MRTLQRIALCSLVLACAPAAWSAGSSNLSEAQARYKQERARCMSGQSSQDRATCLKEAGAALAEAKRGGLSTGAVGQNATARCDAQPTADKAACIARVQGAGTTSGSVEGGGIIRQTETVVPAK